MNIFHGILRIKKKRITVGVTKKLQDEAIRFYDKRHRSDFVCVICQRELRKLWFDKGPPFNVDDLHFAL